MFRLSKEDGDKIGLQAQRHLINNFKLATELGAELIRVKQNNVANAIIKIAEEKAITTVCIGKPHLSLFKIIMNTAIFNHLLTKLSAANIDVVILHNRIMRLKTKLSLSLVFLFIVILLFGILGIVNINILSRESTRIQK